MNIRCELSGFSIHEIIVTLTRQFAQLKPPVRQSFKSAITYINLLQVIENYFKIVKSHIFL